MCLSGATVCGVYRQKGIDIKGFAPLRGKEEKVTQCAGNVKKKKSAQKKQMITKAAQMTDRLREETLCEGKAGRVRTWVLCFYVFALYYHFPRQEDVFLPRHHHRHTLSLLGAAQHGYEFLLATACHIYSVHLHTHKKNKTHTEE